MTLTRFITKNALRNKRRTSLTVMSMGFSLALLIMMQSVTKMLTNPDMDEATALRVVISPRTSIFEGMPLSYVDKVRKVPNVDEVLILEFYNGFYKDPKEFFGSVATDPPTLFKIFPEINVSQEAIDAIKREKTGAIVGVKLMKRYGWRVGQQVTLQGTMRPVDLEFKIVGTYTATKIDEASFYFRYDYMNEALGGTDRVAALWVKAANLDAIPQICQDVDAMFRNSSTETRTETERSWMVSFLGMLGNIRLLMASIAGVVVFTMILVSTSTMAMTIRERLREIAILKSLGFPRRLVLFLTVGEAVFICMMGGVLSWGLVFCLKFIDLYSLTQGLIPYLPVNWTSYASSLATALGIGLVASFWPALRGSGMPITVALRQLN